MFRESIESGPNVSQLSNPEIVELKTERVELDEHIFENLHELEAIIPEDRKDWYNKWLNIVDEDKFRQVDMLFSSLSSKSYKRLPGKTKHEALPMYLGQLGKELKNTGIEVPWYDSARDDIRTESESQILKMVATHDVLVESLIYSKKHDESGKVDPYKAKLMNRVVKKLAKLPIETRADFEHLVTDENYYHESLARLRAQLEKQLASQEGQKKAA